MVKNTNAGLSGLVEGFVKNNIYTKVAAIMFMVAKMQFAMTLLSMAVSYTLPFFFWIFYVIFVWSSVMLAIRGWLENINLDQGENHENNQFTL